MLKLKHLFENFDLAKECLGLYDADMRSADKLRSIEKLIEKE